MFFWIIYEFSLFFVGFLEKWTKREKSGQLQGSFAAEKRSLVAAKDPHAAARPKGMLARPWVLCDEAELRLSEATVHNMEMMCFCFVLFFHCSEDLSIGLIRIL